MAEKEKKTTRSKTTAKKTVKKAPAKKTEAKKEVDRYFEAVGRRKTSVARVRLFTQGDKDVKVNENWKSIFLLWSCSRFPFLLWKR